MSSFENILYLFLVILVGYGARKLRLVGENARSVLSGYVLNIALPFMILDNLRFEFEQEILANSLRMMLIGLLVFTASAVLSELSTKLWNLPDSQRASYHFGMVLPNTGFLGLPVLRLTYGAQAAFYGTMIQVFFVVFNFTYGVYVFTRGEGYKVKWKDLINPCMIAIILGFSLFLFSVPVPSVFERLMAGLGGTATPLTMLIIGLMLAEIRLRELFTAVKPLLLALYRNLAFPLALYLILRLLGFSGPMLYVPVLQFGMPVAANTVIFAQGYKKDYKMATKVVLVSMTFTLVSIPLLIDLI